MGAPTITPSTFANINQFYFYPQYGWRAADFSNMQTWMYQTIGALAAGGFGSSIQNGYGVSTASGMVLDVAPGIAFNVNGVPMVLANATLVTVATPVGNPAWSLIVARPTTTDTNQITNPSNPTGPTVPLSTILGVSIICLNGTPAGSPAYPTPLSTDVVLMGLKIPSGTTTLTSAMFDPSQSYQVSGEYLPLVGGTLTGNLTIATSNGVTLNLRSQSNSTGIVTLNMTGGYATPGYPQTNWNSYFNDGTTNQLLCAIEVYNTSATASASGGEFYLRTTTTAGVNTTGLIIDNNQNVTLGSTNSTAHSLNTLTATSANAGSNGDVPAQVVGYIVMTINGATQKIPYYAN